MQTARMNRKSFIDCCRSAVNKIFVNRKTSCAPAQLVFVVILGMYVCAYNANRGYGRCIFFLRRKASGKYDARFVGLSCMSIMYLKVSLPQIFAKHKTINFAGKNFDLMKCR